MIGTITPVEAERRLYEHHRHIRLYNRRVIKRRQRLAGFLGTILFFVIYGILCKIAL